MLTLRASFKSSLVLPRLQCTEAAFADLANQSVQSKPRFGQVLDNELNAVCGTFAALGRVRLLLVGNYIPNFWRKG